MPENADSYFPNRDGMSERQQRVADLIDQGHSPAAATGIVFAEQAGYPAPPPATNGGDEPMD